MKLFILSAFLLTLLQQKASAYSTSFYLCGSSEAIPYEWVCNGEPDCDDESDESRCRCKQGEFQCLNGHCIGDEYYCDGNVDCTDRSDETSCPNIAPRVPCTSWQFRCDTGYCVRAAFVCDGDDDCLDYSDEQNCTTNCTESQFTCETEGECIPRNWQCDSEPDCSDGSDEMDCAPISFPCGFGFFNCTTIGCININLLCDNSVDCPADSSDEDDCPNGGTVCRDFEFQCADSSMGCIDRKWLCDGDDDCGDNSDETGCEGVCTYYQFECTTGGCANVTSKCDGVIDCRDGSDEFVCPYPPPSIQCRDNQYSCLDSQQCISLEQVCDGTENCRDGTDELTSLCSQTAMLGSCGSNNASCEHFCHDLPGGHVICTCRYGYQLGSDRRSCHDIDECQYPFQCSQYCTNLEGGFNCSCADGYVSHPTRGCKATIGNAQLILANHEDIRSLHLHGDGSSILIKNLHNCIALDYHYRYGYLYWTDISQDVIRRSTLDGEHITTIINQDLDSPGGLAVDWVNDKLYWTDGGTQRIETAHIDGSNRTVLFSTELSEPRAIVVDPEVGLLFWTDWGAEPKIERSSMDGHNRTVLHSVHIVWPNGLTVDYITKSLYWADAKLRIIESSFYDGSNRRPVLLESVRHSFAITLFENKLFWSEWETRSIFSTNKGVGHRVQQIKHNVTEIETNLFRPMDLRVVHPLRQRSTPNPCAHGNGGCEFLCLLSAFAPEGYSCACPTGIELDSDGKNCKPLNLFLLFAHRTDIRRVSLDTDVPVDILLPLVNMSSSMGLDWDDRTDQLFWTDIFLDSISVSKIDGTNQRVLLTNNLVTPAGLAVDWLTNKLYWTDDSDRSRIEVAEFDGSNRAIVVHGNLGKPRDIIVHPTAGLMFWTDWGSYPRIERAHLDGSGRVAIVSNDLIYPNGLAIDYELERLYWCDGAGYIEYSNFDGSNRVSIINSTHNHPFGLALHGPWLYWTDWESGSIHRANKLTGSQRQEIIAGLNQPMDVHVFHRNRTRSGTHPCLTDNGGCSHLCLSRPSVGLEGGVEASCTCPTGYSLMEGDTHTCKPYIDNYLLFATGNQLRQISLETGYLANVVLPVQNIRAVTTAVVDIQTDYYYWGDPVESKIFRVSMNGGEPEDFLTQDILKPESLALDWIGRNLYWADSQLGRIEVVQLERRSRHVLINNLKHVTSVAIDLKSHLIFWVVAGDRTDQVSPQIERATMDGNSRRSIITTDLGQPRSVTIDNQLGVGARIYWTDSGKGTIESSNYDGTGRTVIVEYPQDTLASPFGIALSGDHIYWTDFSTSSVYRAHKSDGSEFLVLLDQLTSVSGITLVSKVDLDRKASFDHGCDSVGQSCSDICLTNVATSIFTCACPTGLSLLDDETTCKTSADEYILISGRHSIRRVSLDNDGDFNDVTLVSGLRNVLTLDHLLTTPTDGIMIYSDISLHTIYSANLNGTNVRPLITGVNMSEGLAIDWISHNVYWTDAGSKTVEVASLDGRYRKVLYTVAVDNPRAIALYPAKGLMFWTDWGETPKIESGLMDGSHRQVLISSDIQWPNGLAVDRENGRLYWVDAQYATLESCDFSGNSRETIIQSSSPLISFPFGLAFFRGFVFWSDWDLQSLFRMRVGDEHSDLLIQHFPLTTVMQPIVVSTQQPREGELDLSGPCAVDNGGCPYLCLTHDQTERTCACPDDITSCIEAGQPSGTLGSPITPTTPPITTTTETTPTEPSDDKTDPPSRPDPLDIGQNFGFTLPPPITPSNTHSPVSSNTLTLSELFMIVFGFLIFLLVIVTLIIIYVVLRCLRRQNKTPPRSRPRLEATNPNYCVSKVGGPVPLSKLDGETNIIDTSKSEKIIGNLLPKRHNNDPHRRPPTPTNANLFIDQPDVFIIPEPQRKKRPLPNPLPRLEVHSDESPSPPMPPKHPKHPRRKPSSSLTPSTKQQKTAKASKERSKTVRFDASIPPEVEPPPIPRKGIPADSRTGPSYLPKVINTFVPLDVSGSDSSNATESTDIPSEIESQKPLIDSSPTPSSSETVSVESSC